MTASAWAAALLAGLAQILFSPRAATGAALLAAVAVVAPAHALGAVLGAGAATALAIARRWNRYLLRDGIFGFNGALVGLVWPALFPLTSTGFLLLVPAALAATWLQGRLLPPFSRRGLPVLGIPFLLVTWATMALGRLAGVVTIAAGPLPQVTGPPAGWHDLALAASVWATAERVWPAVVLAAAAGWLASPSVLGRMLLGAASGVAVSVALGGLAGLLWIGAVAYNAAPAAIALAGVFFPLSNATVLLAALGAGAAALLWTLSIPLLIAAGLFPLTAPMHAVVLGVLLVARGRRVAREPRERLPFARAGAPLRVEGAVASPDVEALGGMLRRSSRIVVLSGAGMSTESGVPDYRSQLGFWFDANAKDLVYQRFLDSERSRRLYWRLQRRFAAVLARTAPNGGHRALVALEASGRLQGIITQNVDGLHQAAGSAPGKVVELHGSARWVVCLGCGRRWSWGEVAARVRSTAPPCEACGGLLKTDTVAFGEPVDPGRLAQAVAWCREADLLLICGSSLSVAPAAGLPEIVRARNAPVVVVNRTPTPWDAQAGLVLRGSTAPVLDAAVRDLASQRVRAMTRPDYLYLCEVVDGWWGDAVRYLLHPIYVEHFGDTAIVYEDERGLGGFLLGIVSQARPGEAYVHMIGTAPDRRGRGIGRALYERFFDLARARGCRRVVAITVPYNGGSLAFHRRLGFAFREAGAAWQGDLPVMLDWAGAGVHCVVMERPI